MALERDPCSIVADSSASGRTTTTSKSGKFGESSNSEQSIDLTDFKFEYLLGEGSYSKIYLVKKKDDGDLFALKKIFLKESHSVEKEDSQRDQIRLERDLLVKLGHPFIVKLKYAFQKGRNFYLVLPFIQGGQVMPYLRLEKIKPQRERL